MTTEQYSFCLYEVKNYTDRDAYISDIALSSIWGDSQEDDIPYDRLIDIGQIWDAYNRSVPQIAAAAGLSQRKLAERFGIPYRTVENWCGGKNACPAYVRMMMQECLGMLPDIKL